jgi:hypothetical protein
VICYFLAACPSTRRLKAFLVGNLLLASLLIAATSTALPEGNAAPKDLYPLFAKKAQVYGAFVVANLVLLSALVVLLRHPTGGPSISVGLPGCASEEEKSLSQAQAGAA